MAMGFLSISLVKGAAFLSNKGLEPGVEIVELRASCPMILSLAGGTETPLQPNVLYAHPPADFVVTCEAEGGGALDLRWLCEPTPGAVPLRPPVE